MSLKCITEGCGKIKYRRGVCTTCYGRFYERVWSGQSTDEEEVRQGRVLPSAKESNKQKLKDKDGRRIGWKKGGTCG